MVLLRFFLGISYGEPLHPPEFLKAAHGKVLTLDNLRRRGFCLIEWCYQCKCDGESVDHVLPHYSVARGLWSDVFLYSKYCLGET